MGASLAGSRPGARWVTPGVTHRGLLPERSKTAGRRDAPVAHGVEATLPVDGGVVEAVALADLVRPQAVAARHDGQFALLLDQLHDRAALAGVVTPLVG